MRNVYTNLSTSVETGITPEWPCTLMIYPGDVGGFESTAKPGISAKIAIEVRRGNQQYQRFPDLEFKEGVCTPLDLPGCTIRVVAENLTNVTVEIVDSRGDA